MSLHRIDHGVCKDGIEKCQSKARECAVNRHMLVATSIASVAEPSAAKVISRGTAVFVPTTTIDHSFLAICPGLSPKDNAIIALHWAPSKVVCVCAHMHLHVLACVNECPLNLRLCPLSTLFPPSLLHTLNLLCPLSILFQVSFLHLHVLSLLAGHSVSCKPSPSTNIPLFTICLV